MEDPGWFLLPLSYLSYIEEIENFFKLFVSRVAANPRGLVNQKDTSFPRNKMATLLGIE